ncbi:MAG TPA: ATP-binding protein, partial [Chitinophagaceae bacterium]|nr:ATP-binding protein [Chitinophagaceae bacterium]
VMNTAADVTDLNVAMQKVRQSEENFRSMILQAPVAMCILIGKDHVIDIANDAMINLWGKPQEHVMHKPVFEALPDAREQGLESLLDHVYETGESFSASERPVELVRQGKPEIVYQNFVYAPYRGADGNILGVLVISIDVTPQVLARKKIEEAEQKARLAIESADLGTYEFYIKTDEVAASPRFHDIWGIGNTSSRQQYANIIHPEDLPGRNEAITEAYRTGNLNYEARIITPENKLKWVKMRGVVLKDEQQEPERILGVVQDITEQKLFAEELRKRVEEQTAELLNAHKTLLSTNNYFRHIINKFDAALACLVPVFQDGKIADFYFKLTNTAYAVYANSTPEAIQNKLVSELFPGYYQTDVFDRYVTVFNTGEPQNWELHYNADGLNVFLLVAASKMNDEVVINFSDITELKNLQLDLLRKIEELERLNRNLEEFAYAASHDMKEPIRKIHVFIDMLKKSLTGKLSANEQGYFNRVETAARRMSTLIDDLLAYSEADHVTGHAETVNLNELIAQVLSDLDLEIEQRHAVVHVGDLSIVRGHRRQLQQAFQNLIGNALKYGKPHEPPVINITCSRTKGDQPGLHLTAEEQAKTYNRITIRDNGIGFEQAEAERIFNVFTRLHVKSEYKGTGIGLSIVRKVIQNHHGYIWAEAQPDAGASFHILLPADQ